MKKLMIALLPLAFAISGCSPEVGSKAWCEKMAKKPKGDWTANEAGDYTTNCLFRSDEK